MIDTCTREWVELACNGMFNEWHEGDDVYWVAVGGGLLFPVGFDGDYSPWMTDYWVAFNYEDKPIKVLNVFEAVDSQLLPEWACRILDCDDVLMPRGALHSYALLHGANRACERAEEEREKHDPVY